MAIQATTGPSYIRKGLQCMYQHPKETGISVAQVAICSAFILMGMGICNALDDKTPIAGFATAGVALFEGALIKTATKKVASMAQSKISIHNPLQILATTIIAASPPSTLLKVLCTVVGAFVLNKFFYPHGEEKRKNLPFYATAFGTGCAHVIRYFPINYVLMLMTVTICYIAAFFFKSLNP